MIFCRACLSAVLILLAACAGKPPGEAGATAAGSAGIEIAFADMLAPEVLEFEAEAAIAGADETGGLWAAVPELPRPERGRLHSSETGRSVVVPLFRGSDLRISRPAAAALELDDRSTARLSIVAVRSEVRLVNGDAGW